MTSHTSQHEFVALTGATGMIGHELLARLLRRGIRCVAVVRRPEVDLKRLITLLQPLGIDVQDSVSAERLVLMQGDLLKHIDSANGLPITDLIHLAGCTRFHQDRNGDPTRTNILGTRLMLEWAARSSIAHFHLASTAYAAGHTSGVVAESALAKPGTFNNDYEQSKWVCEQECLAWGEGNPSRCVTVLRPSIVVGEWATGRTTSFSGLYLAIRGAKTAVDLVRRGSTPGKRYIDLRIPGAADQLQNIVPVDYVADLLAAIVSEAPHESTRFVNITHPAPPTNELIRQAVESVLSFDGFTFATDGADRPRTRIERAFDRIIEPICPYFAYSPEFSRHQAAAIERRFGIRCPHYDLSALERLCRFAVEPTQRTSNEAPPKLDAQAAHYFERFLPESIEQSEVAKRIALTATVRFTLTDIPNGAWLCRFERGRLAQVQRSSNGVQEQFGYRLDVRTFFSIVTAKLDPQDAFLSGRIELQGDIERALKMAMVLHQFNGEIPYLGQLDLPSGETLVHG